MLNIVFLELFLLNSEVIFRGHSRGILRRKYFFKLNKKFCLYSFVIKFEVKKPPSEYDFWG
jgi:hypothetical protein